LIQQYYKPAGEKFKYKIPNSKYQIPNTKFQIPNTGFQIPNSKFQIPNPEENKKKAPARGAKGLMITGI
jgi:hypothetical protein